MPLPWQSTEEKMPAMAIPGRRKGEAGSTRRASEGDGASSAAAERVLLKPLEYSAYTFHDTQYSEEEVLLNPHVFPDARDGDVMEFYAKGAPSDRRVVLKAKLCSGLTSNCPFSIRKSVKEAFNIPAIKIMMGQASPKDVAADYVELTIKGQFVPRADLYRFLTAVSGSTAYGGKMFELPGMLRARVHRVNRNKEPVYAGVISRKTHVSCRSRSSRIFWLVQLSIEMFDLNQRGFNYYEVLMDFVQELLARWKELDVSHYLTVVFFSRTYYCGNAGSSKIETKDGLTERPILIASDGRLYEDTYKVVVHNKTMAQFGGLELQWKLMDEILAFPVTMGWFKPVDLTAPMPAARAQGQSVEGGGSCGTAGQAAAAAASPAPRLGDHGVRLAVPSYSSTGNVLEALNVTLNVLHNHYMDRDLTRSGNSVVMITAGTGVFRVDERLSDTTAQRMMDNGIGMDMVSLSQPPLHTAPLFIFEKPEVMLASGVSQAEIQAATAAAAAAAGGVVGDVANAQHEAQKQCYGVPHWCNLTFASASRPRCSPDASHKSAPSDLARPDSPTGDDPNAAWRGKPVYMPRLVDPGPFTRTPDGSIDMQSLCMPTVLAVLTGHKSVRKIGEKKPQQASGDDGVDGIGRDDQEQRSSFCIEPWSVVERRYPQPEPGPAGAFEVARRLAELRARLKHSVPAPPPAAAACVAAAVAVAARLERSCAVQGGHHHHRNNALPAVGPLASGLMTPETLGTSPGGGFCVSPRSLGSRQATILQHISRPWPDKDNYVGAMAQPTLRSPRGQGAGSGGFSAGGAGGEGESSGAAAVAAMGMGPRQSAAVRPRVSRSPFLKRMSDEEWELMKPKFAAYDEQVTKAKVEDSPPGGSTTSEKLNAWASRKVHGSSHQEVLRRPQQFGPTQLSRTSSAGRPRVYHSSGEEKYGYVVGEIALPLSSPRRSSLTASETGAAESDGSSAASSPNMPNDAFDDGVAIGSSGGRPSGDRTSSPTLRNSSGPRITPPPGGVWHRGGKLEHPRPSSSPGTQDFWPTKSGSTKLRVEERRNSSTEGVGGSGKSPSGVGSPLGAGPSPPPASPTLSTPRTGPPVQLWTTLTESGERPFVAITDPFPSPAGPSATTPGLGTTPPPVTMLGGGFLRGPGAGAGAPSPQGRPRPAPERPRLSSNLRPYSSGSGSGGTRGPVRQVVQQPRESTTPARGASGGGSSRGGGGDAPMVSAPVKIEKPSGRGRKVTTSRKGGSGGIMVTSSPRPVPVGEGEASGSASGGVQGRGQGQGRTALGMGVWPSSSLETPGALTTLKAEKVKPSLGRRPVRKPHSSSGGVGAGGDSSGNLLDRGLLSIGPNSDTPISVDGDSFERDGRRQASVESAGSGFGGGGGGGSSGGGGASGSVSSKRGSVQTRSRAGTGFSDTGSGGRGRLLSEVEFNPFKKQDEKELLESRTHNRRRWTHVFPAGQAEIQTADTMPGPIWKSLTQPTLLPLTTDFVPDPRAMRLYYDEKPNDVGLDIDPRMGIEDQRCSVRRLLEDMVCQRIAQDYQLVEQDGTGKGQHEQAYDSLARRALDIPGNMKMDGGNNFKVNRSNVRILSMGHRLQTLSYPKSALVVKVRTFILKEGRSGSNGYVYRYSLWVPSARYVQTVQQTFFKYPEREYSFNHVDNLISGEDSDLTRHYNKYRRLLFSIIPPEVKTKREEDSFIAALNKLAGHLNQKEQRGAIAEKQQHAPVSFQFRRIFGEGSDEQDARALLEDLAIPRRHSARMDLSAPVASNGLSAEDAKMRGKEDEKDDKKDKKDRKERKDDRRDRKDRKDDRKDKKDVEKEDKGEKKRDPKPYYEWLDVVHDEVVDVTRVIQLDVRWLLCSAARVAEYVKGLYGCAADLHLCLRQVPEYARVAEINLHPLITHPYIQVPPCSLADEAAIISSVEQRLVDTMDYVRDHNVQTDWKAFGLELPTAGGLEGLVRSGKRQCPPGRVYFHRSGAAFVRVAPKGFAFLENLHWRDNGETAEQGGEPGCAYPRKF